MKIKIYYRKNLKLTEGKVASQCGHVAKELGRMCPSYPKGDVIIVLGVSDNKYQELSLQQKLGDSYWYEQVDAGSTEVDEGTPTAFGYIEHE